MFHSLKALLLLTGIDVNNHKNIFYRFYKEFVEKKVVSKEIFKELLQLRYWREEADYGLTYNLFDAQDANQSIEVAKLVINLAEKRLKK